MTNHAAKCEEITERKRRRLEENLEKVEFTLLEDTGHITLINQSNPTDPGSIENVKLRIFR